MTPPVEKGKYPVFIHKSELKPTVNGAGTIIAFATTINGGANHGRNIMFNLNWENQSQKAIEIGRGRLAAIATCCGVTHVMDTQQLHNIMFELEVDVTPDGKYNDVIGIHPIAQPQAPVQATPQPPYQPTPVQQVQQPVMQPQTYEQMAQPVQQFQPAPVVQPVMQQVPQATGVVGGAPAVPDWIKNQQAAQAAAAPMGNA